MYNRFFLVQALSFLIFMFFNHFFFLLLGLISFFLSVRIICFFSIIIGFSVIPINFFLTSSLNPNKSAYTPLVNDVPPCNLGVSYCNNSTF
jgi:hypothetical protein